MTSPPTNHSPRNKPRWNRRMHGRNRSKGRRRIWTTTDSTRATGCATLDAAAIERELQEVMGGRSEKEIYGERHRNQRTQPSADAAQRRKGRVVAVRGPDVFVDVPGERSQGVLPVAQFSEGPPAVGAEVEFTVEGYDEENGLLTPVAPRGRGPGRLVHRRRRHGRRSPRNGHE